MAKEAASAEQAVSEIEAALRSMEALASKPASAGRSSRPKGSTPGSGSASPKSRQRIFGAAFRWLVAVAAIATLPLLILVRLSVWFYTDYGLWPWIAAIGGAVSGAFVFIVVALMVIKGTTGGIRAPRYFKRAVFGLVLVYCGYSALFVSAGNVKSTDVRATYRSLHPSLRLALSTWMLVDSRLVITDAERQIEDYARMGLPRNEASLHLVTSSGHVHAVDLRTIGRPEWRNFLTTVYFKAMGFRTLRHTGTADHLHVSIPIQE
ncbi:MAG TPA: hypothetical protein VJB15_12000 [Rhodothermia bacterium]|nr:hypothetical protein [Rhodothermia bacterium]